VNQVPDRDGENSKDVLQLREVWRLATGGDGMYGREPKGA
jgi:hypothetical protein